MPAKIKIDDEQLEKLAMRGWGPKAIAHFFNCSEDTIIRRFADRIELCKARGGATALDMAWQKAGKGSDKCIEILLDRLLGKVKSKVEISNEELTSLVAEKLESEPKEDT